MTHIFVYPAFDVNAGFHHPLAQPQRIIEKRIFVAHEYACLRPSGGEGVISVFLAQEVLGEVEGRGQWMILDVAILRPEILP